MSQRRMPSMDTIVAHWREHTGEIPNLPAHWIGWGEPFCFACGWLPPVADGRHDSWRLAGKWFDRAHLEDHSWRRNDDPSNIVPLCHLCHSQMPEFEDRAAALAWVIDRPHAEDGWQAWTDVRLRGRTVSRATTLLRAWAAYLTACRDIEEAVT